MPLVWGEMKRGGTYSGACTNSYTMWCSCGAVVHSAKDFRKRITGFEVHYQYDGGEKE